jgi:death-on-curing protein
MKVEPRWIDRLVVDAIHFDTIRSHGGMRGVRDEGDEGVLESALVRPRQKASYEPTADIFDLAAAYGFGLARNHPFNDGNKRVAFVTMVVFLELNGSEFDAAETDVVTVMLALAAGEMTETALADWLRTSSR